MRQIPQKRKKERLQTLLAVNKLRLARIQLIKRLEQEYLFQLTMDQFVELDKSNAVLRQTYKKIERLPRKILLSLRSFGEATCGVPTGNQGKTLSDGAFLSLTTILGADRTGQIYDGPLIPDRPVQIDWNCLGTDNDPVLQTALQWLQAETGSL